MVREWKTILSHLRRLGCLHSLPPATASAQPENTNLLHAAVWVSECQSVEPGIDGHGLQLQLQCDVAVWELIAASQPKHPLQPLPQACDSYGPPYHLCCPGPPSRTSNNSQATCLQRPCLLLSTPCPCMHACTHATTLRASPGT